VLAAFLALFGVFAAPTAAAAAAHDHAAFLDRDATVVVRVDLDHLERALVAARRASSTIDTGAAALAAVASARAGWNPLAAEGWRAAGFDPDRPILASALAIDGSAADAALRSGKRPALWWRSRIVLPVADPERATQAARRAAQLLPGLQVGAPSRHAVVEGRLAGTSVRIVVQRKGDAFLVDALAPFAGIDDEASARRAAARPGTGAPPPAAASLAEPGLALWTAPDRVITAYELAARWERARRIERALGHASDLPVVGDPACRAFHGLAATGALADLELRLRAEPDRLRARARWTIRDSSQLAAHLETAPAVIHPPARAQLAFAWTIAHPSRLAALPRPSELDRPSREVRRHASACGIGGRLILWAFGWPELAGAFFHQLANVGPRSKTIADSVGPGAGAARALGPDLDRVVAAVEIVARDAGGVSGHLDELFDSIFGGRRAGPAAIEHLWGQGRLKPYRRTHREGAMTYGAGRGGRSIAWFTAARAPRQAPPAGAWGWLRLDGGQMLEAAASRAPALIRWLDRGPRALGWIDARATTAGDALAIEAVVDLR
jgi:hypothetical protein